MNPNDPITKHFRLSLPQRQAVARLKLTTLENLLHHLPSRYEDPGEEKLIRDLVAGDLATVYGEVVSSKISKAFRKKIPMSELVVADSTGRLKAIWFHQAYMAKKANVGDFVRLKGKVSDRKGELYISNPALDRVESLAPVGSLWQDDTNRVSVMTPIYPETRGLSSSWLEHAIKKLISSEELLSALQDPMPPKLLERYHLPSLRTALIWIHQPQKLADAEAARKRFAFQEVFLIQLTRLSARAHYQSQPSFKIEIPSEAIRSFASGFNFKLTNAQERAINTILGDLKSGKPMARLLEGDVGSGKTAVAALTAAACVRTGFEVAYMAPTEILARQHFESFINYFKQIGNPPQVGLITGTECRKFPSKLELGGHTNISRSQLLKWVGGGQIPILIGTHSLIQKTVKFKNLAYVIIDEQHRFGVMQRSNLVRKNVAKPPHLLSMTATPIPRTLALTIYGDLDLTLLDARPAGHQPIITEILGEDNRSQAYNRVRNELKAGRQAYVICPRIDLPDPTKELALQAKSAKQEKERLEKEIFPDVPIGLLHSKMPADDKEEVMADFTAGKIKILVATSVVEVGVNVPNATVILIEGAERFGLAQLHQLRGRVWRSTHQAYCFLLTDKDSAKGKERLEGVAKAKSGFELAELDLKLRGPGSLAGRAQWGLSDVGMEALKNLKMVEAARAEATDLLKLDPQLKHFPLLAERVADKEEIHLE